ncbi:small GTPase RanA [Histoplasma capsulatum G186AR]|uniref:GTP-binding nuclear protein n=1 Tax=Ajellomyces capsulatus (strain G186AR / H82 / ATCC MYA-2454 / RMSCC 2432) TaxID=447093 RepID=C0NCH3_AJECG|nr:small GTPase RanA [Histoplasma capsulatum G186AR]EEH11364.1 small GTPase RanA [Histoplasma capsulatum G186AR]
MEFPVRTFKVVVVGDGGVGKRSGPIVFDVWDCAGQQEYRGISDGYYMNSDAGIIMFDVTSRTTYKNVLTWYGELRKAAGDEIPIVLCGNKVDVKGRKVRYGDITSGLEAGLQYYDISVKRDFNIKEPFLWLTRKLVGNASLEFVPDTSTPPNTAEKSCGQEMGPNEDNDLDRESENGHQEDLAENLDEPNVTDVDADTATGESSLFVLCICCTRMILIRSNLNSDIAKLSPSSTSKFSLAVTSCRHCLKSQAWSKTSELSREMLEKSRIYECARKVAGEETVVTLGDSIVSPVPVLTLLSNLSPECRVCGIQTSGTVLQRLDEVDGESLILPHLPGAFL